MQLLETEPIVQDSDTSNWDIAHCTCTVCYPNHATEPHVSMCGAPKHPTGDAPEPPENQRCVVCVDLAPKPWQKCGA